MLQDDIKNRLEIQYITKVNTLLGCSIDELSLTRSKVVVENCIDCKKEFRISDFELEEDNIAIFCRECKGLPVESYCVGSEKSKVSDTLAYRFCYDDVCVETVKNAIIKSDMIRAVARSRNKTYELCINRLKHNRKVSGTQISQMFDSMCRSFISGRSRMWHEIDEGLRRLLVMPTDEFKNENKIEGEISNQKGFSIRALHGHQFRELIRNDKYNVAVGKPDIICVGHFHLLMVFKKFDTWIVMTGHFMGHNIPREKGFLCHMGAPEMSLEESSADPFFRIVRARES